jgi:CheY-like chemotaxis protein
MLHNIKIENMKKTSLILGTLLALGIFTNCQAQTSKTTRKEISKEISVEDENGVKRVIIKSTEDGKTTVETFTGKEAEAKLKELEELEDPASEENTAAVVGDIIIDVNMEDVNGVKTLTVKRTENGKTATETYTGAEAETKLKELEKNPPAGEKGKTVTQSVRVVKTED